MVVTTDSSIYYYCTLYMHKCKVFSIISLTISTIPLKYVDLTKNTLNFRVLAITLSFPPNSLFGVKQPDWHAYIQKIPHECLKHRGRRARCGLTARPIRPIDPFGYI